MKTLFAGLSVILLAITPVLAQPPTPKPKTPHHAPAPKTTPKTLS